ncbi:hypothetical protein JW868_02265 [Candidatus Woesearchaeota archaeon]|nr:hypothetical protein [Candidatus Woesearchaeota archaeon]
MAFDKSLDKQLFAEKAEFEMTKLTVGVFSYNDGPKKLQISRENRNQDSGDWIWAKMGRLTKDEVEKILPLIQKALKQMD